MIGKFVLILNEKKRMNRILKENIKSGSVDIDKLIEKDSPIGLEPNIESWIPTFTPDIPEADSEKYLKITEQYDSNPNSLSTNSQSQENLTEEVVRKDTAKSKKIPKTRGVKRKVDEDSPQLSKSVHIKSQTFVIWLIIFIALYKY
eukprot:GHVL01042568.1.p1 GENE.GHVL01042568.1~~GHVL01042568.1.p1  ORF type:complete len:146 (+),score=22.10 GHVL01042568.1:368-805(+)